jgi:cysteine synthase
VVADESERFRLRAFTNTALQATRVHARGLVHPLWLKLELCNPTGSVKFRTAIGLLSALTAQFPVRPGSRVVESTSGNLGLAMACLLAELDCQFVAVIDPKVTPHMRQAMQAAGACLVLVSESDAHHSYLSQRLHKVNELLSDDARLRWTDQYHNPANPAIHRDFTAMEILRQTDRAVDVVLAAVSTGGTLAGLSAGLRDADITDGPADRAAARVRVDVLLADVVSAFGRPVGVDQPGVRVSGQPAGGQRWRQKAAMA